MKKADGFDRVEHCADLRHPAARPRGFPVTGNRNKAPGDFLYPFVSDFFDRQPGQDIVVNTVKELPEINYKGAARVGIVRLTETPEMRCKPGKRETCPLAFY